MSPEQARGEAVDHRSDLFSLGSVLYAMCTGHPPFRADSTLAVLRRVCDDAPRPLREVNPEVPDWLAAIVDRLHAKDPAERFPSAAEVAGVLKHHLAELAAHGDFGPTPPVPPQGGTPETSDRKTAAAVLLTSAVVLRPGRDRGCQTGNSPCCRPSATAHPQAANAAEGGGWRSPGRSGRRGQKTRVTRLSARAIRPRRNLGLTDFDSLEIMHPFLVEVIRADRFGVSVTADDNVLEHVKAVKEGSALKISLEEGKNYRMKAGSLKARSSMPALAELGLSHGPTGRFVASSRTDPSRPRCPMAARWRARSRRGDISFDASHGSTLDLKGKAATDGSVVSHGSKLISDRSGPPRVRGRREHGSTSAVRRHVDRGLEGPGVPRQ